MFFSSSTHRYLKLDFETSKEKLGGKSGTSPSQTKPLVKWLVYIFLVYFLNIGFSFKRKQECGHTAYIVPLFSHITTFLTVTYPLQTF